MLLWSKGLKLSIVSCIWLENKNTKKVCMLLMIPHNFISDKNGNLQIKKFMYT